MLPRRWRTARVSPSIPVNIRKGHLLPWEFGPHDQILIVAPHPDDEVLAAGGVIATFLKSHALSEIRVIVATNGDASYATAFLHGSHMPRKNNFRNLAVIRQQESINALAVLGLGAEQVRFWGFPDRGLALLWKKHKKTQIPYHSRTTGYNNSAQALNSPIMSFTGENLLELFHKELCEFCPTSIILPHLQDAHSDHSALAGFTLTAVRRYLTQTQLQPPILLTYRIWLWRRPWLTGIRLRRFNQLSFKDKTVLMKGHYVLLTPEVREQKRRALRCYRSQKQVAGRVLRSAAKSAYEVFTLCDLANVYVKDNLGEYKYLKRTLQLLATLVLMWLFLERGIHAVH
jgi:LmbE family N-acetylglucosaminyl deacetylase